MHLNSISVLNFKNIEQLELDFCPKLNCFLGDNGAGKTNLLDSIYFLSFTKSFFNSVDGSNVKHGSEMFMLQGDYTVAGDRQTVSCGFKNGHKKQFKVGTKVYKRLSDHIGLLPLVMISPADTMLVTGGSDERRKFMDGVISQYDRTFLEALIRYNRVLLQRNNLLKIFSDNKSFDSETISIYDEQLVEYGQMIFSKRNEFIDQMIPVFQQFYNFISGGKEVVRLQYVSQLNSNDYRSQLIENQRKDLSVQFTNIGIHKDDLLLSLGDYPIKKLGSQGQTKTYLLALKFAQFEFLKKLSGVKPILLLDDIFDKLDANRVGKIIELVSDDQFGQIFVTDTNRDHIEGILKQMNTKYLIYRIEDGRLSNT